MGRRQSYKKSFMPPADVEHWWHKVQPDLQTYTPEWLSEKRHPSLLCSQYLNLFFQHYFKNPIASHLKAGALCADLPSELPQELKPWNNYLFRGVKVAVNRTLLNWYQGHYPLELFFYVPEPLEVLTQQAQGKRCVSCILSLPREGYVHGDRDPWSFLIHDLLHADQFYFQNQSQKEQQLLCYLFLLGYQFQIWQPLWTMQPESQAQLEYVFSDMNSHPIHILKVLKSILIHYRYFEIWSEQFLSLAPNLIQHWWPEFIKLNTPEENSHSHRQLMLGLHKSSHSISEFQQNADLKLTAVTL